MSMIVDAVKKNVCYKYWANECTKTRMTFQSVFTYKTSKLCIVENRQQRIVCMHKLLWKYPFSTALWFTQNPTIRIHVASCNYKKEVNLSQLQKYWNPF